MTLYTDDSCPCCLEKSVHKAVFKCGHHMCKACYQGYTTSRLGRV